MYVIFPQAPADNRITLSEEKKEQCNPKITYRTWELINCEVNLCLTFQVHSSNLGLDYPCVWYKKREKPQKEAQKVYKIKTHSNDLNILKYNLPMGCCNHMNCKLEDTHKLTE